MSVPSACAGYPTSPAQPAQEQVFQVHGARPGVVDPGVTVGHGRDVVPQRSGVDPSTRDVAQVPARSRLQPRSVDFACDQVHHLFGVRRLLRNALRQQLVPRARRPGPHRPLREPVQELVGEREHALGQRAALGRTLLEQARVALDLCQALQKLCGLVCGFPSSPALYRAASSMAVAVLLAGPDF